MLNKVKFWGLVPAAGSGARLNSQLPKQYLSLGKQSMLEISICSLLACDIMDNVIVVLAAGDDHFQTLGLSDHPKINTCIGSDERFKSVYCGMQKLAELGAKPDDWVLVHDAARPCLTQDDLQTLIVALREDKVGGLLAVPLQDTVKRVSEGKVIETISREQLWRAQTPQMFRFGVLKKALENAIRNSSEKKISVTDEAMAIELLGLQPKIILGSQNNIKVTYAEDIAMAKSILAKKPTFRIGHGYDVHQFTENRKLVLGGVEVPYTKGLLGHSDADVVLHALCDALLGAVALGDIGQHFPDTKAEHKNRDSKEFLMQIYEKVKKEGFLLINADVTITAQVPKISPYILAMRECISEICAVDMTQISVKATTTERLGFVGREEGIAAYAVVLLER